MSFNFSLLYHATIHIPIFYSINFNILLLTYYIGRLFSSYVFFYFNSIIMLCLYFWKCPPYKFLCQKFEEAWEPLEKRTRFIVYHHHQQMALGIDGKNCCMRTVFHGQKISKKGGPIFWTSCKGYMMSHVSAKLSY